MGTIENSRDEDGSGIGDECQTLHHCPTETLPVLTDPLCPLSKSQQDMASISKGQVTHAACECPPNWHTGVNKALNSHGQHSWPTLSEL